LNQQAITPSERGMISVAHGIGIRSFRDPNGDRQELCVVFVSLLKIGYKQNPITNHKRRQSCKRN
jgi:hypothetical protein